VPQSFTFPKFHPPFSTKPFNSQELKTASNKRPNTFGVRQSTLKSISASIWKVYYLRAKRRGRFFHQQRGGGNGNNGNSKQQKEREGAKRAQKNIN
jgi:hypothetical protein